MGFRQKLSTVLILLLLVFSWSCSRGEDRRAQAEVSAKPSQPLPVRVVPANQRELRRILESVGTLFAYEEVVVSSEVEGKASEVLVDVGDRVSQGQVLVRISPTELQLASDQQKAALEQIRARLGLLDGETTLKDLREAAAVKKAAADLSDAQQKYQRAQELLEQGLLPRQSYEEAESRHKSAQANYDLALQEVRNLVAALHQVRATNELAEKKLRDTQILAPISGYIKQRSVSAGQFLRVQTPVLTLVRVDPLRARVTIPEKMAGWIPLGQPISISVEAYPERKFTGKISRMNPSVDAQTRSFEAEALVENSEGLLKPGFFVRASIPSNRAEHIVSVPEKALSYAYGVYTLFAVQDNRLVQREVKIGDRLGEEVEILAGLSAGEPVAIPVHPSQPLYDGALVEIAPQGNSQPDPGKAEAPPLPEGRTAGRARGKS